MSSREREWGGLGEQEQQEQEEQQEKHDFNP